MSAVTLWLGGRGKEGVSDVTYGWEGEERKGVSDVTLWLGGRGKEGGVRRDTVAGRERKGRGCQT